MIAETQIAELEFDQYKQRQQQEVTLSGLQARVEKVRASDKFSCNNGVWTKEPYPGYAIVSMVNNNSGNEALLTTLKEIQDQLAKALQAPYKYYMLPSDSFHQTVANTLSSSRFEKHVLHAGIAEEYPSMISNAFDQLDLMVEDAPICMDMIGLSVFGSALGVLGTFQKQTDFERIIRFRDAFYTTAELNAIDIRRTRPFIGHITLAYLDGDFTTEDRLMLAETCHQINQRLLSEPATFKISNTELRKYNDLSHFQAHPHFPTYSFTS